MNTVLSLLPVIFAATNQANLPADLLALEKRFLENEFAAKTNLKGKSLTIPTYVIGVKEEKGKVILSAGSLMDGKTLYVTATLLPASKSVALKLRPGDFIKFTGKFESRVVHTKERLVIDGYIPSATSSIGGSIQGGTVTDKWPVFTFTATRVSIVETAAARERATKKAEADAAAKKAKVDAIWKEAAEKFDVKRLDEAIKAGVPSNYLDSALEEINRMDPGLAIYPQVKEFYLAIMKSGKANGAFAIARAIGIDPAWGGTAPVRPELFKLLVDNDFVNFTFTFANGDTFLHYFLKDPILLNPNKASQRVKLSFYAQDLALIEAFAAKAPKGVADIKDAYGKTARDYAKEATSFVDREGILEKIKKIIADMP